MSAELTLDKGQVKRAFEHAAQRYDAAAVLQHEVCSRMLDRLQYIRLKPRAILDAGSGTGNALKPLMTRFPATPVIALDLAFSMLTHGRARLAWWQNLPGLRPPLFSICADLERLPLADATVGLVWSNLALQWMNDLQHTFQEMYRVLQPGGLLMFSTFGPDTLKELRQACSGIDGRTHVNDFIDMHDIGDMLVNSRYADPVMDMEPITVTYSDVRGLMRDLKSIGAHNVTRDRPRGLSGKSLVATIERNYEVFRREGKLPATFEVVYGHAWKPQPRVSTTGHRVIDISTAP